MLDTLTILKNYLEANNITKNDWAEISNPTSSLENDPYLIKDMREWLNTLYHHRQDVITIVGDYDADGILASATMHKGLSILNIGSKLNVYVPTRQDGYGITKTSVNKIKNQFPDTQCIITIDNGIAAFEGVAEAKNNGWTVLVTDHHLSKIEPLPTFEEIKALVSQSSQKDQIPYQIQVQDHFETVSMNLKEITKLANAQQLTLTPTQILPFTDVAVDINRTDDNYPFKGISGTTMAYKTLLAYAKGVQPEVIPLIQQLRDLVGISTITDMMPLRHENRFYVTYALDQVQPMLDDMHMPSANPQLTTLIAELNKKNRLFNKIADSDLFGFQIGPILNAPSRVSGSPEIAYQFFQATDQETLTKLANQLIDINDRRKAIVGTTSEKIVADFQQQLDTGDNINAMATRVNLTSGFVGLVAGKLTQQFNKPAIAFSTVSFDGEILTQPNDIIHGSARSITGVSIIDILNTINQREPDLLVGFGGHAAAAGLAIHYQDFEKFNTLFKKIVDTNSNYLQKITEHDFGYTINVHIQEITQDLIQTFNALAPFGQEFPKPKFKLQHVPTFQMRTMGANQQHIKFNYAGLDIIQWNGSESFKRLNSPESIDVIGNLSINNFRGQPQIQMITDYIAPDEMI